LTPVLERRARLDGWAVALMLLLCLLWGIQQVGTKVAAQQGLPPLVQASARSIGASILVLSWVWLTAGGTAARAMLQVDRSFGPGLLIGAVFTAEFILLFEGVTRTTASHATLLLYTAPFWTALGAHVWIPGESLSRRQAIGLVCAFVGVAVAAGSGGGNWAGDAMVMGGALLWGVVNVLIRCSTGLRGQAPARVLLYQLGPSAVLLLLLSVATEAWVNVADATRLAWGALAYQTFVVAFASYLTWFWLMTRYQVSRLSAFTVVTPLFGIVAGGVLLHEALPLGLYAGFALVAAGLRLVNTLR